MLYSRWKSALSIVSLGTPLSHRNLLQLACEGERGWETRRQKIEICDWLLPLGRTCMNVLHTKRVHVTVYSYPGR